MWYRGIRLHARQPCISQEKRGKEGGHEFGSNYSATAANAACVCEHDNSIDPSFGIVSMFRNSGMHHHESFRDTKMSHFCRLNSTHCLLFLLPVWASRLFTRIRDASRSHCVVRINLRAGYCPVTDCSMHVGGRCKGHWFDFLMPLKSAQLKQSQRDL